MKTTESRRTRNSTLKRSRPRAARKRDSGPRGMLDSAGDFFYKRRLTNRRGVFRAAPQFCRPWGTRGVSPRLRYAGDAPSAPGDAQVAQLVEQRTENPRVGGSIPPLGTILTRLSMEWMTGGGDRGRHRQRLAPDADFHADPATPSEASPFNHAPPRWSGKAVGSDGHLPSAPTEYLPEFQFANGGKVIHIALPAPHHLLGGVFRYAIEKSQD